MKLQAARPTDARRHGAGHGGDGGSALGGAAERSADGPPAEPRAHRAAPRGVTAALTPTPARSPAAAPPPAARPGRHSRMRMLKARTPRSPCRKMPKLSIRAPFSQPRSPGPAPGGGLRAAPRLQLGGVTPMAGPGRCPPRRRTAAEATSRPAAEAAPPAPLPAPGGPPRCVTAGGARPEARPLRERGARRPRREGSPARGRRSCGRSALKPSAPARSRP